MKTFCNNLGCKSNQVFLLEKSALHEQILELQEIFLEPGIHYLHVTSFGEGRAIIKEYLAALRCFTEPACFSLQPDDFGVPNIADQVKSAQLATFFDLEFDADFFWIECDKSVLESYPTLLITLERIKFPVPILILTQ